MQNEVNQCFPLRSVRIRKVLVQYILFILNVNTVNILIPKLLSN